MNVLIIDNYDSFTFNLYQYIGEILSETGKLFTVMVKRNDELTLEQIKALHPRPYYYLAWSWLAR